MNGILRPPQIKGMRTHGIVRSRPYRFLERRVFLAHTRRRAPDRTFHLAGHRRRPDRCLKTFAANPDRETCRGFIAVNIGKHPHFGEIDDNAFSRRIGQDMPRGQNQFAALARNPRIGLRVGGAQLDIP